MRGRLLGFAVALALAVLTAGCTSIITYIRNDNSTGTARCEPETDTGGIFSVRRDCIINQPSASPGNVSTSTDRRRQEGASQPNEAASASPSPTPTHTPTPW
jgi:hypothetical protein